MAWMGLLYEHGRGVEKNHDEALAWYRKAASLGNEAGKAGIARLERDI